jgi:hypothetical protein
LERIRNAFLNRKNWDEVMVKRQRAVVRQQDRFVVSSPCTGFSFSTSHYPPDLLDLLIECGGALLTVKIQFTCSYHTERTNANTPLARVLKGKGKWKFKGSCFGCETLKNIACNVIANYFMNIKVGIIYTIYPPISIHKLDQWLGIMAHSRKNYF